MAQNNLTASFEESIRALLAGKKYAALREVLRVMNAADIAALFDNLECQGAAVLFRLLPKELAAETFVDMDGELQEQLIRGFSDMELKAVVDELYVDDAVDLIEEMPANVVQRILRQADPETRREINRILQYPPDSAGSIMTTEYIILRTGMTAAQAIDHIRQTGTDSETIYTAYVTGPDRKLLGSVSLRALLLAKPQELVETLMQDHVISAVTGEDKEAVTVLMDKYDLYALPVVDEESRLVGIVTIDDAVDVLREEATEDIEKMAAITPGEKPYLKTSVLQIFKARIPWLLLMMISATFTGMIITSFESALAAQVALTAFIPMLMDTGGNSGSQASVTVIRGLSLGEIGFSDYLRVLWKEARVSVLCAVALAAVGFAKMLLIDRVSVTIAAVVCITLALTVVCAKCVGCSLPMLAKRIGFDPAVMASPFITTIVDAFSLVIYFTVATALLHL